MLGSAALARIVAEAPSARVSARHAPTAPRLGPVARERRRLEARFGNLGASRASASGSVSHETQALPSASTSGESFREVLASPYEPSASTRAPSEPRFEPQVQVGPTVASLTILVAFAIVNRRVAAAVDRRKEREDAEEALRLAKLRSLDGSADFDEVQSFGDALENARAAEAEAREVLAFLGADVRVRMPQPLGKPIAQVEEEEARVGREIDRRRTASRSNEDGDERRRRRRDDGDGSVSGAGPPGWMTATVGFVLAILTWSATGLIFSPDPAVGPALTSEQVREQLAVRGYDAKRFD